MNKSSVAPEISPLYLSQKAADFEKERQRLIREQQEEAEKESRFYYVKVVDIK